ncbi:MAG: 50S ribosomal protein L15 [Candidatus Omnitrophica bacterium ADurb.Bin277]|nr:MAG: 50S ribosomal protein L15 [Candidatus Omnitrophica bacterium ADurb.Bin277]
MRHKTPYKKRKKRVGRGIGSGRGKTSTKGHKGQRSRSGYRFRPGFEGGQNPLHRRLPKRGFNNTEFETVYSVVNLKQIAGLSEKEVTPELLIRRGVVKKLQDGIKILGDGDLKDAVTVKAHCFSASAKAKIEAKGGQAVRITK